MIVIATQCFPPRIGGVETLMAGLAEAASAAGRDVLVLADGARDPSDGEASYQVRRFAGLKPVRRRLKAWAAARAARRADLVICDSWKSLEHLPRRSGATRAHVLAHGMELPVAPSADKARRIAAAFSKADKIIANSRYVAERARRFVANDAALVVATPPISEQSGPTDDARRWIAEAAGEAEPLIAFVGRLEPRKGVDRVIAALPQIAQKCPGVRFLVAGGGEDRPRLEALVAERGLADRVRFLGRVDEAQKAALLERARLFAMPVRREGDSVEGFGIVYLEAGWRGVPSLAGREGGAADAVLDGETGAVVDGDDVDAVAAGVLRLTEDPVAWTRLSYLAKAHARDQRWSNRLRDFI